MSFSGKVREELSENISQARHCRIAELAAFIGMCGTVSIDSFDRYHIKIHSENIVVARKVFTLLKKTFNIRTDISVKRNVKRESVSYLVVIKSHEDALRVLQATKMIGEQQVGTDAICGFNPLIIRQVCCRRAFLRGVFQAAGSMSDPNKSYHFEIVCTISEIAEQIRSVICSFGLDAKIVRRKKSYVVYLKEGSQIVDILNVMEAHVALMELENVRILKEMRNSVNRKVNCETANINKTVSAAVKQVEDITYLRDMIGFENMPDNLVEAAYARLDHPDATLKELGESLTPPVGKSGINHRLRKLSEMAESLRQKQEGRRIIMIKTPVVVKTEEDFDGRPIALLVQEASQYASTIYIQVGEKHINAKSIMGMMSLSLADGEEITVVTDGEDEQRAAEGIKTFFAKGRK